MATQELHLDLQDSDYLGTQASCPDIKNFHVRVCSENNDCINPGDLSGRSGRDKYGVPRNQTGNLSVKVKEEEDVRSDIPQAGVTGNSSMTNKSNSEGNLNAKSDTNSDFQTKSELVGVNLGHESMMKVYEHISRFSHQKASDFEFKIDGGETSESIPQCVNDGFGIQTGKCMDLLNVKVKEEAAVTNNKWNVVECALHNKTQKESNPCKCVNVKTDFTLMERETGVRQDVHEYQSMIANSHSIACRKADASVPKMLIRENPPEDQGNTRNDVHSDTCSRHWKENPQIFPIALNQIRIKLPITEEIQQQLHQKCLQEQREGNRTVGGEMEQKKGNQTHGEKMEEENEIKSQSYMYGCQRKSDPNKVLHQEERPTYACRQCDKVFLTYGGRTRHEELHLALTFKCDMCSSTFKKQNYLRDHIMRVHRQKDLECEICGKVYGYKKALKLHLSTCTLRKQATEVHSFEQGKTFGVHLHQLKDHIKRTHDVERLQKSNVSSESLTTGSVPEQHTESHQELTSHECDVCHKSYKSMDILRTHKLLHKEERPTYPCRQCDKVFLTYGGRTRHKELHLALTFKCDMCSLTFKKQKYLRNHIERIHVHHQKDHQCKICGKVFGYQKTLKRHMNIHTQLPVNAVNEQSGKAFEDQKSLHNHMLSHSDERPYQCRYCEKTYKSAYNCDKHMATVHNNPKPNCCRYCLQRFSSKNSLLLHVEAVHSESPITICAHCGRCFTTEVALKHHQGSQICRDSILCEQCGKIVSKQSIKKHLKSHKNSDKKDTDNTNQTGLYVCAICKKSLKSKIARRYHMRVHLSEDINV